MPKIEKQEITYLSMNINDFVEVRLTSYGHKVIKDHHDFIFKGKVSFIPSAEIDGWSRWQLWELMRVFGEYMGLGMEEVVFESDIRIKL